MQMCRRPPNAHVGDFGAFGALAFQETGRVNTAGCLLVEPLAQTLTLRLRARG